MAVTKLTRKISQIATAAIVRSTPALVNYAIIRTSFSRLKTCAIVTVISLWIVAFYAYTIHAGFATDFYPVWRAAREVLAGGNPYGAKFTASLSGEWAASFARAGFAYPLPVALAITPLALIPFNVAAVLWLTAGLIGAWATITINPSWRSIILLPIVFMPFWQAAALGQVTLLTMAAIGLFLVFSHRVDSLAGLSIALMTLKPQAGYIIALAALWEIRNTAALAWVFILTAVTWIAPFAIIPTWPEMWIQQVLRYSNIVDPISMLPSTILALTLYSDALVMAAIAQVVLFPITDIYSFLPLMLAWAQIGGRLALAGAGLSWLCFFSKSSLAIVAWIVFPLVACSVIRRYQCKSFLLWQL